MKLWAKGFHGLFDTQFATLSHWMVIEQKRVPHHVVTHSQRLSYRFRMHFHPYAERMLVELVSKDIEGLEDLDTRTPELRQDFFEDLYKPKTTVALRSAADLGSEPAAVLSKVLGEHDEVARNLLPVKEIDFDYAEGAYSVYNWEVFYHVPFTIAVQLSKNQRYAEAQRWFHYIFDPTDNGPGPTPQRYWKVKPFRVDEVPHIEETLLNLSTGADADLQERTVTAIGAWRRSPFRPHLVARTRPTAYMYATVMAYLDNLIAWGDSLFRQDTKESINEAMQYYVLAANILGPAPQAVPKKGSVKKQTYASLSADLDEFGNAARELEAEIPFDLLGAGQPAEGSAEDGPLESLGRSLYFCVPRNTKLLGYWDTVGDRLFKIRNSLNLQGVFRQLPLFPPPIDPAMMARAVAAGVDVASIVAGTAAPLSPVRFPFVLRSAIEICQEVKSLGNQILAALEKKDNEALGALRAGYEASALERAEAVRYAQWQEAIKNREGIEKNIASAFQRYRYYERLLGRTDAEIRPPVVEPIVAAQIDDRALVTTEAEVQPRPIDVDIDSGSTEGGHKISRGEAQELELLSQAQSYQDAAAALDTLGSVLALIPDFALKAMPFGLGADARFGGTNLDNLIRATASATRGIGARLDADAKRAAKMASFGRREQEWAVQSNAAAAEVTHLHKQLRAAEIREHIAKREYENHLSQVAAAKDVKDFLENEKRKTTTEKFYLWMKGEAQGLHARYFQLAYEVAKKAERAFQHELGVPDASFLGAGYTSGREGLFAGEKLQLDLKRMEVAYAEQNTRELEITKHVSLRDWFPLALLTLRATGKCEIDIPEALFDLDHPGHFFRRIKSVAISIPCVTGPYASVSASLSLSRSHVRTKATALGGAYYPADPEDPDTDRFTIYPVATGAIVTSSAQNDTGMFDPSLRDDRYLPFEGAGVISKWNIELPGQPRQFDYDTIADVVLTIRYSARPGAAPATVIPAVEAWLAAGSAKLFSMRHEFTSAWARFRKIQVAPGGTASLPFELGMDHYPYRMQGALSKGKRVHLFARTAASSVEVELLRGATSIGSTTLGEGQGVIVPPKQSGQPGTFDARGAFELRFDTTDLEDLWLVVDWSPEES